MERKIERGSASIAALVAMLLALLIGLVERDTWFEDYPIPIYAGEAD